MKAAKRRQGVQRNSEDGGPLKRPQVMGVERGTRRGPSAVVVVGPKALLRVTRQAEGVEGRKGGQCRYRSNTSLWRVIGE